MYISPTYYTNAIEGIRVETQDVYGHISILPCGIERAHAQTVHSAMHDNDFSLKLEVQGSNSYKP